MIIKPLGELVVVTTANAVANSNLVRIHSSTATTVTLANVGGTIGSFSMPANSVDIIEKSATDTIACSAAANCTPVAFKH